MACLATAVASAATQGVWKWVDAQGVIHYSDQPVPGATRVDINVPAPATTGPPATRAAPSAATRPTEPRPTGLPYRSIRIVSPAAEQVFINTGGMVQVAVTTEPSLLTGHAIAISLDGSRADIGPGSMQLGNVARGTHTLAVSVVDRSGRLVQPGPTVTFHVRQEAIAQPPVGPNLRPRG